MTGTHHCPGCDRPGVPNAALTCRACWPRIPAWLQRRVYATAALSPVSPRRAEVLAAVMEALAGGGGSTSGAAPADPGPRHGPATEIREDTP